MKGVGFNRREASGSALHTGAAHLRRLGLQRIGPARGVCSLLIILCFWGISGVSFSSIILVLGSIILVLGY